VPFGQARSAQSAWSGDTQAAASAVFKQREPRSQSWSTTHSGLQEPNKQALPTGQSDVSWQVSPFGTSLRAFAPVNS
jgi:hypothetical protein